MPGNEPDVVYHDEDAQRLAELGYKQQFERRWNGFSNFAISFSIISILSGCFTTFGQAWNNGGPVAISIGWPIIAALILIVVGLLFLLATACFGYLGITLSSDKSYRDLAPFLLIGSGVCALIFYGVVRGLIKMLKKR